MMEGAPDGTKMPTDEEMKEMAKQIPPQLLPMLKRLVEAAEEVNGGETSTSTALASEEKPKVTREAIKKIGNSDEASEMKRACFMWPEEICRMALKEVMDEKNKQPETVNGAMLVMEEVVWAQPEDVTMWKKSLKMVAGKWVGDQIDAEVPFIPPDSAKAHCFYLMDEKACDEWLVKNGFPKAGKTGKQLLDDANSDEEGYEKFIDAVLEENVLFMKDLVVEASKESKDTEKNET